MILRSLCPGEWPLLAALHQKCFADGWDARSLEDLAAGGALALLAESESRLAGFVLFRTAADEAEILTIAVEPSLRRRGVGRALAEAAANACVALGAKRLFLEVAAGNGPARRLYAGLGFGEAGRRKDYYRTPKRAPEDALILAADLPLSGWENPSR